ncbi:hypothetical protein CHLRE_03g157526v5 [Chlamydomonas reinhardtii]|uniref:Uncharacterized protein n=1 Tax=Chlamydomonas reinhardtii TaxID=3055 RepID=A0A2K3DW60_CHLRE|nr:uncharacterized protein CHLRE_03g157526v5 [Chlamydomonas reinhardtii]PNW84759.1 hypothetical protein CHLRE_03g157526v5 [Chlamydomonas reinhardtii]
MFQSPSAYGVICIGLWRALAGSGGLWRALAGSGGLWRALAGSARNLGSRDGRGSHREERLW